MKKSFLIEQKITGFLSMIKRFLLSDESQVTLVQIYSKGVLFIIFALTSKFFSVENYASLVIIFSIIFVINELSNIGLLQGLTRYTAEVRHDRSSLNSAVFTALVNGLGVFVFGAMVLFFINAFGFLGQRISESIPYILCYTLLSVFMSSLNSVLNGLGWYSYYAKSIVIKSTLLLIGVLVFTVFSKLTVNFILLSYIISGIATFIFQIFILRSLLSISYNHEATKHIWGFGKWYTFLSIFYVLDDRFEIFLMSQISTADNIAIYDISTKFLFFVQVFITGCSTVLNPEFVSAQTEEALAILKRKVRLIKRYLIFWNITVMPFVCIFVVVYYKGVYNEALLSYVVQSLGMFFVIMTFPLSAVVYKVNKPHFFLVTAISSAFTKVIFSLLLIPSFGALGAAFSMVMSMSSVYFLTFFYVKSLCEKNIHGAVKLN